jgi:hypothetical protein
LACASVIILDEKCPAREIAGFDRVEQVTAVAFAVSCYEGFGLGIGQVLDALLRAEVKFDPDAFVRRIDHRKAMTTEPVHVAEAFWDAAVRHDEGDLVQCFRQQRPEIPVVAGAAQPSARIALDRVVDVGKAQRVARAFARAWLSADRSAGDNLPALAPDEARAAGGALRIPSAPTRSQRAINLDRQRFDRNAYPRQPTAPPLTSSRLVPPTRTRHDRLRRSKRQL